MIPSARRTLVTGASRPLGLELVRQCLERGDRVIATCRNPARVVALADLRAKYGTLDLIALDPADATSVAEAVPILESITDSIDLLLIAPGEPGSHERDSDARDADLASISATDVLEHYRRHAVAPLLLVRTLLPLLIAGERAAVLFVSTTEPFMQASPADHHGSAPYAASASRAALETLVQVLAPDVLKYGVTVASRMAASDASVTSAAVSASGARSQAHDAMVSSLHDLLDTVQG